MSLSRSSAGPGRKTPVVWRPGLIDVRLLLVYVKATYGLTKKQVRERLGWSRYRFDRVIERKEALWPRERKNLAKALGVPTTYYGVLAVRLQQWTPDNHPPPGAF